MKMSNSDPEANLTKSQTMPQTNSSLPPTRRAHVVSNVRHLKAIKIEKILELEQRQSPLRLLDVGAGSGGIAQYFGSHISGRFSVDAVDVTDSRETVENYSFQVVRDTTLPFPDNSFDVVISNHVIEHVGNEQAQRHHLSELRRVLKPDGVGYFAVPNRWMLVEPHYKLVFLSWLPHNIRSCYLKLFRGISFYDCEPLTLTQTEKLLEEAGFSYENKCLEALRLTLLLEFSPNSIHRKIFNLVSNNMIRRMYPIIPTLIYRFHRSPIGPA